MFFKSSTEPIASKGKIYLHRFILSRPPHLFCAKLFFCETKIDISNCQKTLSNRSTSTKFQLQVKITSGLAQRNKNCLVNLNQVTHRHYIRPILGHTVGQIKIISKKLFDLNFNLILNVLAQLLLGCCLSNY